MISYALFVLFAGGAAVREASGDVSDLVNGSIVGVIPPCLQNNVSLKLNSKSDW